MIRIIEHALKECITKSMLRSYRPIELFYENKFSESDGVPRKTWQVINELTSRKTGRSSVRELSVNGVSITNSTTLSNAFNDHFSTIGRNWQAKYLTIMALVYRNISLALVKDFSSSPLIAIRFCLFLKN